METVIRSGQNKNESKSQSDRQNKTSRIQKLQLKQNF